MRKLLPLLLTLLLLPAAGATAAPVLHAHRGGALVEGRPTTPENTLEAFREIARTPEVVLEMDSVVSSDGVPFVIHDSTLDRTTNCAGDVVARTAAFVAACTVDTIGASETLAPAPMGAMPVRVPRLSEVLALAKASGSAVNLEIKRIPGDPGYVPGDRVFAARVMAVVKAAQLPRERVIIQSFDPSNLDVAKEELPGVITSLLTLAAANEGAPEMAAARGYEYVSPGGVPSPAFLARARQLGRLVVPYTLNTVEEVQAAAAAGVDAVITDDVPLARRALGLPASSGSTSSGSAPSGSTPSAPAPSAPTSSAPAPASAGATGPSTTPMASGPLARRRSAVIVSFTRRTPASAARRGGVPVVLAARRAARVELVARLGARVVARGTIRLGGAGRRTVLLRLTPAGRRALAKRRSARLRVGVRIDGAAATTRTVRLR